MYNFEKKKLHIQNLQAPNELETRLTNALKQQPKKRTNKPIFLIAAVALLFLTITFNINGFAYYGKKLFGYEELMTDTLKELNEKGLGQTVEQSIQLNDGTIVTIDGIVSDMNRVIVYYREENKEQPLHDNFSFNKIQGFLTNAYFSSGSSQTNNDGPQRTGIAVCAEDGGQHDVGHECVVTGRDVFSIRSFILTTAKSSLKRIINT